MAGAVKRLWLSLWNWLVFCTGVVPTVSSDIRKLTTVGENVLVQTPVYNVFGGKLLTRLWPDTQRLYDRKRQMEELIWLKQSGVN